MMASQSSAAELPRLCPTLWPTPPTSLASTRSLASLISCWCEPGWFAQEPGNGEENASLLPLRAS
jgi:hypothetical protein